jgi:hypothetical protein
MQRVEGRQSKAIRGFEVMKDLSHELRRRARMLLIPRAGDNEIVGAGQFQAPVSLRLVENDLGMVDVHDTVAHQGVIHVVEAHRPEVVAAHATEFKVIPLVLGHLHILKAFGRFPNNSEQGALLALLVLRQFVLRCPCVRVDVLRQGAQGTNAHENESDQGILELRHESSDSHVTSGNLCGTHWICLLFNFELVLDYVWSAAACDGSVDGWVFDEPRGSVSVREFVTISSEIVPDLDQNTMAIYGSEFEHRFFRKPIRLDRCGRSDEYTAKVCTANLNNVVSGAQEFVLTCRARNASDSELNGNVGSHSLFGLGITPGGEEQNN